MNKFGVLANLYSARLCCIYFSLIDKLLWLRDKPLENVWWRAGEVQKYSRKGKLNEKKIHARQVILKNIHAMT